MEKRRKITMPWLLAFLFLTVLCAAGQPLRSYAAENIAAVREAYAEGNRVFDEAGLLSASEIERLSLDIRDAQEETGFDLSVYTTDENDGLKQAETFADAEDLADYIYYEGAFGVGEERSGVLFLLDMESREYYLYTKGNAARYLTDSALDAMIEYDIFPCLSDGDYEGAFASFISDTAKLYRAGIQEGQYHYNEETGERDYAPSPGRGLKLWQLAAAILMSGGIAYLPCRSVIKSYAMEKEKKLAKGFSLAYRAEANFRFVQQETEAKLLNRFVTTVPIPKVRNNHPPRGGFGGGISGMGGGRSTMRMGRGGGMHGGRGGKF